MLILSTIQTLKYEFTHETETILEEEKYYADNASQNVLLKALTKKQKQWQEIHTF